MSYFDPRDPRHDDERFELITHLSGLCLIAAYVGYLMAGLSWNMF